MLLNDCTLPLKKMKSVSYIFKNNFHPNLTF